LKLKTYPFDAARHLKTERSHKELLSDAVASGDARYIAAALGVIARARGMAKVASEAGITREALYTSLSEEGDPRLTTLLGVSKALGIRLNLEVEKRPKPRAKPRRKSKAAA